MRLSAAEFRAPETILLFSASWRMGSGTMMG